MRQEDCFHIFTDEPVCMNCKHFHTHYVYDERRGYTAIYSGHCVYPRNKTRYITDTCGHFDPQAQ